MPLRAGLGVGVCGFEVIIGLVTLAAWIWAILDCVKRQFKDDTMKIVWVIVIVLAGVVGVIVYAIVGRPMGTLPGEGGGGGNTG